MRLASGLAQVVNYMLGIYAEPPFGLHGWTDTYWGKFYIYIFIQPMYTYICIHTYTHACNRHYSKEGQQKNTQPEQQALALRIQYARIGVCAS